LKFEKLAISPEANEIFLKCHVLALCFLACSYPNISEWDISFSSPGSGTRHHFVGPSFGSFSSPPKQQSCKGFFFGKAKAKANLPATENLETVSDIRQV
jgi:hypothetical protein